jgi:uncharacterized lipoprotein YbaY
MPTTKPSFVLGEIIFEDDEFLDLLRHHPNCKIVVQLEDVTVADVSSRIVTRQIAGCLDLPSYGNISRNDPFTIPFKLFYEIGDKQRRYAVSVHVDMDGDGKVSMGDYINMQSYPVITQGYPTQISVKVIRVD